MTRTTTCLHCDGTDPLTVPNDADWTMCPTCEAAELAAEASALRFN